MNKKFGRIAAFMLAALALGWGGIAHAGLIGIDRSTGNLYGISTADASLTLIGNTGLTNLGSLEFASDGTLYGFTTGSASTLYTIDPTTADKTLVGALGNGFIFEGGLAIAPDGSAFGSNQNNALTAPTLFSIDLGSGAATNIGIISTPPHDIDGLVYRSDGMLVGLDRETNSLLTIDPGTAASSVIAALTPTIGGVGGLVATTGTMGFFSTGGPLTGGSAIPGSNELYSVDLFTGAHSLIGSFGSTISGFGISGLAYMPDAVPEPATLALFGAGLAGLGFMRRRRRDA